MLLSILSLATLFATDPSPACLKEDFILEVGPKASEENRFSRDLACHVRLKVPANTKTVAIVPTGTAVSEFDEKQCTLEVPPSEVPSTLLVPKDAANARCSGLFDPDVAGWSMQLDGKWTDVVWDAPQTSAYTVPKDKTALPSEIAAGQPHYRKLPSQLMWTEGANTDIAMDLNGAKPGGVLAAALAAHAEHDTGLEVLVSVPNQRGGYKLAKLKIERKAVASTDNVTGPTDLRAACRDAAELPKPHDARSDSASEHTSGLTKGERRRQLRAKKRLERQLRARATRADDWHYVVCINAVNPQTYEAVIVTTREGADPTAERTGTHIFSGRPVDVRVWANPKATVKVELGGTAGVLKRIAGPPESEKLLPGTGVPATEFRKQFAGRSTEADFVDLKVTQSIETGEGEKAKKKELPEISIPIRVEDAWLGAFRFAASAAWAPWDRTWNTRTRTMGLNPGHEVKIDEGAGAGLAHMEFVAGYSIFWRPVYEDERTVSVATFFGLGVLSTSASDDLSLFSSVHVTPVELVVGRYFGVGLDVALRRTERLNAALDVGSPVADGQDITRFGVTPTFGVVLNFSPEFVQTVGLARKGFKG